MLQTQAELPRWAGDPEAQDRLEDALLGAMRSTEAYGAWPSGAWTLLLHADARGFEQATGAPSFRSAAWVGGVLHLRPWEQLRRRDLGAVLRHELVHRRLRGGGLGRWEEEARCLWAEGHPRPPETWPLAPESELQARLDSALASGITSTQRWAYAWIRAWLEGRSTPPRLQGPAESPWEPDGRRVTIAWPPERMPLNLVVHGKSLRWKPGASFRWSGAVRFGTGAPVDRLDGEISLRALPKGWELRWSVPSPIWIAAATAGELGEEAPYEAKRALAAVLGKWLEGHPDGHHTDGSLCPLTHCAVVRGMPSEESLRAAETAPPLALDPRWAFFTGSQGGISLSPREVWGKGPFGTRTVEGVPGDRWGVWTRAFTPAQIRLLKREVRPGLKPGQRGLYLGASGPYAVESLRLAAGRRFGWTSWPSNACTATLGADGGLGLKGRGWSHNVGLGLAEAIHQASTGRNAEALLQEAFGHWNEDGR